MPDVRLMLRRGLYGRARVDETGGDVPVGDAAAETWRVITGGEPPASGLHLAVNMLVSKRNRDDHLAAVARQCFEQLAGQYGTMAADDRIWCAVDSGREALYCMDAWWIASETPGANYTALRELVQRGKPLVVCAIPIRVPDGLIVPEQR